VQERVAPCLPFPSRVLVQEWPLEAAELQPVTGQRTAGLQENKTRRNRRRPRSAPACSPSQDFDPSAGALPVAPRRWTSKHRGQRGEERGVLDRGVAASCPLPKPRLRTFSRSIISAPSPVIRERAGGQVRPHASELSSIARPSQRGSPPSRRGSTSACGRYRSATRARHEESARSLCYLSLARSSSGELCKTWSIVRGSKPPVTGAAGRLRADCVPRKADEADLTGAADATPPAVSLSSPPLEVASRRRGIQRTGTSLPSSRKGTPPGTWPCEGFQLFSFFFFFPVPPLSSSVMAGDLAAFGVECSGEPSQPVHPPF
jgi:hypothetical protein